MKFHNKLAIFFLLTLFIGCILGSLLKAPVDQLIEKSSGFAKMVDYEDGMYNYGKIMRRIFMIVAVGLLLLFRKQLGFIELVSNGLRPGPRRKKELLIGLFVGVSSLVIYGVYTFVLGIQFFENNPPTTSELITKPFIYLIEACLIGLFEETLFRGFILQGLTRTLSITVSVIAGSLFYAILHFFSFKVLVYTGSQPFVGFSTLIHFFIPANWNIQLILPYIIGLFIVGVVLSLSFLHTKSLYLPIGLHAGWVFGVKLNRFFLDHNHEMSNWFFGDGHIVTGIFGWIFLIGVLIFIKLVTVQNKFESPVKA